MRSSGEQVSAQLMPPGGPSNSKGGGPAGRCFCASLLPCSCPHCCLEEVGGEQGAEVSTGICDVYVEYVMCTVTGVKMSGRYKVAFNACMCRLLHHKKDSLYAT